MQVCMDVAEQKNSLEVSGVECNKIQEVFGKELFDIIDGMPALCEECSNIIDKMAGVEELEEVYAWLEGEVGRVKAACDAGASFRVYS